MDERKELALPLLLLDPALLGGGSSHLRLLLEAFCGLHNDDKQSPKDEQSENRVSEGDSPIAWERPFPLGIDGEYAALRTEYDSK